MCVRERQVSMLGWCENVTLNTNHELQREGFGNDWKYIRESILNVVKLS